MEKTSRADGKKPAGADGDGGSPDSTQAGTDSGVRAQQPPAPVVEATPSPAQVTAPNPEERAKVAVTKKADEATQPPSDEDGRKKACAFLQQSNISFNDGTCGGSGNIKKLRCTGADGKDYDQPYCYCNPGTHLPQIFSEPGMGAFHRGCEKKRTDSDRTSRTSRGSSSNDFWSGFKKVLPFALIGGMMIMQHKAQKEQLDRQYQMYLTQMQSIQPPVPPPSSNVPVDTGGGRIAPTPGATR